MTGKVRYLIVDGHSVIFTWPELRKLHQKRTALAREALIKRLRNYQDWTGVRVVVVFDGQGSNVTGAADPHDIQIFYSRKGQTADAVVERLASKYAGDFELMVATSDLLERQTVTSFGAVSISAEMLRKMLEEAVPRDAIAQRSRSGRAR
jgi:predicted RNA-binding protein with PIN domain